MFLKADCMAKSLIYTFSSGTEWNTCHSVIKRSQYFCPHNIERATSAGWSPLFQCWVMEGLGWTVHDGQQMVCDYLFLTDWNISRFWTITDPTLQRFIHLVGVPGPETVPPADHITVYGTHHHRLVHICQTQAHGTNLTCKIISNLY